MVKAYLPYEFQTILGGVSQNGFIVEGNFIYSAVAQYIIIINIKSQEQKQIIVEDKVTQLTLNKNFIVAGQENGEIVLINRKEKTNYTMIGHSSQITQLLFLNDQTLISGSADTTLCVWDIIDQSLSLRLVGHTNQITGLGSLQLEDQQLGSQKQFIISTSKDGLVKVWDLEFEKSIQTLSSAHSEITSLDIQDNVLLFCTNSEEVLFRKLTLENGKVNIEELGSLKRQNFTRAIQIQQVQKRIFILNNEKKIEVYRQKKKNSEILGKQFVFSHILQFTSKVIQFQAYYEQNTKIIICSQDNQIEIKQYGKDNQEISSNTISSYKNSIKQLELTQFDQRLIVISGKQCNVIDCETNQIIQKYESQQLITSLACFPKKYYIVGDDTGYLNLIDINSNQVVCQYKAHDKSVNNIQIHEKSTAFNGLVIMTTELDKLKFLELFQNKKTQKLELAVINVISMKENIRDAVFTKNGEMYAVSLYNNNIQIYYCNSNKLFLELYGHSLPILSFQLTSDDTILISGGIDKSIKLWAMDFGNCKKTLKNPSEITSIKAVNDTHYFFSGHKDNLVKYWDGDTYQLIMQFNHSLSQITSIIVGCIGDIFYVGTKDGLIRKYIQTKEQIFIQDEEEKRIVEKMTKEMKENQQKQVYSGNDLVGKDLSLQSIGKIHEAEDLMNILEDIKNYRFQQDLGDDVDLFKFNNQQPNEYLFQRLQTSDINQILKFLHAQHLSTLIDEIKRDKSINYYPQICSQIVYYIFNKSEGISLNSHENILSLIQIQERLRDQFKKEKKIIGFNIDALDQLLNDLQKDDDDFIIE